MTLTFIDRYKIIEQLNQGGMGVVYRAYDPDLNREVALKLMAIPDSPQSDTWQRRFRREVQAAAQLNHPHIITIYDVGLGHDPPYVVMELLNGGTLQDVIHPQPLPWREALALIYPLGQALAYAHQAGVIHRDVKPTNVMFGEDKPHLTANESLQSGERSGLTKPELRNVLKLVDFGLARWWDGEPVPQASGIIGTPAYMSPEQAQGQTVDARTDIFALGLILFEAIVGYHPLKGPTQLTWADFISENPLDLSPMREKAPREVISVIEQAVAKERDQRYSSCEAFLTDLAYLLSDTGGSSITYLASQASSAGSRLQPTIQKRADIQLTADIETVLRAMFSNYNQLLVELEFNRGLTNTRVFQVRPIGAGGKDHVPVVVKVGPIGLIQQEWRAYKTWVEETMPSIGRLEGPPIFPSGSLWAGIRYTLVGGDVFEVQSLGDFCRQAPVDEVLRVLEGRLFQLLSKRWWLNNQTGYIQMQAEYDRLLPINLLIKPVEIENDDESQAVQKHHIGPDHIPAATLSSGDYVHLQGFKITEIEEVSGQQLVTLNLFGATEGRPQNSFRLRLELNGGPDHNYQEGMVIDSLYGQVLATRQELLQQQVQLALDDSVTLATDQITLNDNIVLPNPLGHYLNNILQDFRRVKISIIHNDLNLENVLVDPNIGDVRLIDFAAVRQGHALHDLLHLETGVITHLIPEILVQAGLQPQMIHKLFQHLHQLTTSGRLTTFESPYPELNKIFSILAAIRNMARDCLFSSKDWTEYYHGLALYLLGALKFKNLDTIPYAKQVAFIGAATLIDLSEQSPSIGDEIIIDPPAPMQVSKKKIFICYKRNIQPDQTLATYLQNVLTGQGHEVFIDQTMRMGDSWLEEIDRQIKSSDYLVVILSKESADSEMVQAEISRAYEYRRRQGKPQTLPVRVAYEEPLPYPIAFFLNPLQYVVWQDKTETQLMTHQILAAIAGDLPQRPPIVSQAPEKPKKDRLLSEDGRPIQNDELQPPLPEFDPRFLKELEAPGGAVKLRDKFYIEREADQRLMHEIMREGVTITIRAPRQTGKTSLLMRGIYQARQQQAKVVPLDLQGLGEHPMTSLDNFLRELAESICHELQLDEAEIDKQWRRSLTPQKKLTYFLEDRILPQLESSVILAMDEVDALLQTTFYQDFFGLVRAWHNKRALDEKWNKLNIVQVISTEPYMLIPNVNQSPFNVGLKLYLQDFDESQVRHLNRRHGSPVGDQDFPMLMTLLGGHPYLVRRALYTLVTESMTWEELAYIAPADQGPFGDHLRHYHWLLRDEPTLKTALKQIIEQNRCAEETALFRLLRAGLIKGSGHVHTYRCDLYRQYFEDKLL